MRIKTEWIAAPLLLACGFAFAQDSPMAEASRWASAKFDGAAVASPPHPYITVRLASGALERNRRHTVKMQIAGHVYDEGIVMPSPGEIVVHLPSPARSFEAVVGVDSNDLGYYSNAGRGNVIASIEANGNESFRSEVLHEGTPPVPMKVDLNGATEFTIKLSATGVRGPTYQAEWDQADFALASITLTSGNTLRLADLPLGPPERTWSTDAPFSFRYDGKPSADLLPHWSAQRSTHALDPHRTEHATTWTDPATGLIARMAGVTYDDSPVVEWTLYLKNSSSSPTPILESIQAIDAPFDRTPEGEFVLHHSKGSPNAPTDFEPFETPLPPHSEQTIATNGGRPTDANLCYFNLAWAGRGIIIGLGWPGQWSASFHRDADRTVRVSAGQDLTHFRLLPGEEVRSPLVALLFWQGDWIDGQNLWRRWMIAHNLPRPGGHLPPPQLAGGSNRHTIEMQEATEANQKEFLARTLAAGLPIDYWWMDAGWYVYKDGWWKTGTWEPDPARFPNGLAPIAAAAHARHVKTVVWFEPERVAPGTWLAEHHPEWLIGPEGGNKLLFLGNPDALHWLIDHVSRMISEQGIDTYRQDFNFEPLLLWRSHDAADRQGITEIQHITGYLAFWDELRRRFPNLLIDTCASGGRRLDLETLRRSVPLWRSDHAYEPSSMQQQTYGLSLWIPYFGTAVNSVDPYYFFSQMTPAIGLGLDPSRIEAGYQRLGHLIAEWRAVANNYYGDFYPLTPYANAQSAWIAWQFNRPDRSQGFVQVFRRPESPFEAAQLVLRGLDPDATYRVEESNGSITLPNGPREFSGRSLMSGAGLVVNLPNRPAAVLITYHRLP